MADLSPSDLLDFQGKVVLVTGGGSGLGRGIALRFAQAGANVAVNYLTSKSGAEDVAAEIEACGCRSALIQGDVTVKAEVERVVAEVVRQFGRLDVLVNNAGVYPLNDLIEMDEDEWDLVVKTNLRSTYLCTQAAASQMVAQGSGGAVVNISSIEGIQPAPKHSHYVAAKGGVIMFTRAAANELGEHKIRVNAVSPGLVWRDGLDQDWPDGVERYQKAAPLKRVGMPDEVADACLFLASPAARWITGINLVVDGGVMTNNVY
ncbi:MAG: glucose 1-dehydrogenase [Anaerolineales bacterium]|jgi:NAD(P)-dependent dehydrogenase (short-subunit alcohol dehydrogenase family)